MCAAPAKGGVECVPEKGGEDFGHEKGGGRVFGTNPAIMQPRVVHTRIDPAILLERSNIHSEMDLLTASEGEGGSRAATPASIETGSRSFQKQLGTGELADESGNKTAVSLSINDDQSVKQRLRRRRGGEVVDEDTEKALGAAIRKCAKRYTGGRGRPPTTRKYIGSAQATREKNAAEREAPVIEADEEMLNLTRRLLPTPSNRLSENATTSGATMADDETTAAKLGSTISASLEVITNVATKSKNLSGPYVKALRGAASAIQEAYVALLNRSASEETRALEAANARLSSELEELKTELAAVKRELTENRPRVAPLTPTSSVEEMLQQAVREAVSLSSARLEARLERLEAQLLPEPRHHPPLAADNRNAPQVTKIVTGQKKNPEPESAVSTLAPPANPGMAQKKKKKAKKSAAAVEAAAARRDTTVTPAAVPGPPPERESWTEVTRKDRQQQKVGKKNKAPKRKKNKSGKLRAPKSAAVVITLRPGAVERGVTYKEVLEKAKQKLDLSEMQIPAVKFKLAVTGARMYEVSGDACKEKADALAGKLREIMGEEDVRIARPQKCAELRITGLDDSATAVEIAEAVARSGGCKVGDIKVGEIRLDRSGRGSAWLKCPVDAAKKVTAPDTKVYVGWTVVRVTLLSARLMRCYRCHQTGHTRATCTSEDDRSELCFRCGQPGHTTAQCQNAPHCALCAASGKPANHSVGSKSCGKPVPKKKSSSKKSTAPRLAATTSKAATRAGAEEIDVQ